VTVQIRRLSSVFSVKRMGGGNQSSLAHDMGYYTTAQCIGKSSYLEPISGSMQKPIEGRSLLAEKQRKTMLPALYKGGYSHFEH
jgi:hypothetical protein